jgi:hypothetical protein
MMAERIPNQRRMAGHVEERSFSGGRTSYLWKEISGGRRTSLEKASVMASNGASQFHRASPRELYDRSIYFRPARQEHWARQQVHDFERERSGLMIEEARLLASMEAERS